MSNQSWAGFLTPPHLLTILKYKSIIKMSLNSEVFIDKLIYQKIMQSLYEFYKFVLSNLINFYNPDSAESKRYMFCIAEMTEKRLASPLKGISQYSIFQTKLCFFLSGVNRDVSLFSFTIIGTPFGMLSGSINLVFLDRNDIIKMFLKTMGRKKNKHRKIALLAMS